MIPFFNCELKGDVFLRNIDSRFGNDLLNLGNILISHPIFLIFLITVYVLGAKEVDFGPVVRMVEIQLDTCRTAFLAPGLTEAVAPHYFITRNLM